VIVADVAETSVNPPAQETGAAGTPSGVVTTYVQAGVPVVGNSVPVAVIVGAVPAGMTVGLTLVTVG
jgi:hypothetical protein